MKTHSSILALAALATAGFLASCEKPSKVSLTGAEAAATTSTGKTSKPGKNQKWPPASEALDPDLLKENYLVVLDDSGSMAGKKIQQAKNALFSLAQTLPPQHNLGLVLLNKSETVQLQPGNREDFVKAVKAVKAEGGTPLRSVTKKAYQLITKKASTQRGYGSYHMIIVTDGETSDGSPLPLVSKMVAQTAIQVHVIGFHLKDHELNQPSLIDYRTAGNSQELAQAFQAVTAEVEEFSDPQEFSR